MTTAKQDVPGDGDQSPDGPGDPAEKDPAGDAPVPAPKPPSPKPEERGLDIGPGPDGNVREI